MNRKLKNVLKIIFIIFIAIIIITYIIQKNNFFEVEIKGKDELYLKVEKYLINLEYSKKDSIQNYNISDFNVFTDIAKLGIRKKGEETYVYIWALIESYYVQNGEVVINSGSSMPYKFILKNDEIVSYKVPKDGAENEQSLKEIFPYDVRKKLDLSLVNDDEINKKVEEHYSYIKDN